MRTKLLEKLNSRRGASLTFALLLFLVCAAVGSVVLASASATAGRASGNYAYDQRYYAVTSAAELLRDTLDGKGATFTFTRSSKYTQEATYSYDGERFTLDTQGGKTEDASTVSCALRIVRNGGASIVELADGEQTGDPPADLLGRTATSLVKGKAVNAALWTAAGTALFQSGAWLTPDPASVDVPAAMELTVAGQGGLTVTVNSEYKLEGGRLFLILSVSNAEGADKYTIKPTSSADVRETSSSSPFLPDPALHDETIIDENNDGEPEGKVITNYYDKTETKTATLVWRVSDVGKAA